MLEAGIYHNLEVLRSTPNGIYLNDGGDGVLLPNRFVPENIKVGDTLRVFVYHDGEGRLIATTQEPYAIVGEFAKLRVNTVTPQGAFMDWGLMKDLFIAKSQQLSKMILKGEYLVYLYRDERTGRVAATQKFSSLLQNEQLTVTEKEPVNLIIYRRTDIGYLVIINHLHTGVLHFSDIFQSVTEGDRLKGYIKNIRPDKTESSFLMDVALGSPGYGRTENEADKIMRLLHKNNGYLPYYDKSDPEEIYRVFQMSKKTFKMTIGKLYKERKITLTQSGIKLNG